LSFALKPEVHINTNIQKLSAYLPRIEKDRIHYEERPVKLTA
jgi:hypothetical protein